MEQSVVERVAKVARLELTKEELEMFTRDMEEILEHFEILDQAPEVESFGFNPVDITDVLRDDIPKIEISPDELLKDMKIYDGYVRGPKLV